MCRYAYFCVGKYYHFLSLYKVILHILVPLIFTTAPKVEVLLSPFKVPDYKDNVKEPGLRPKSFDSKYLAVLSIEHLFASLLLLNYLGLKAPYEYMSSSYPFVIGCIHTVASTQEL